MSLWREFGETPPAYCGQEDRYEAESVRDDAGVDPGYSGWAERIPLDLTFVGLSQTSPVPSEIPARDRREAAGTLVSEAKR